MLIKATKLETAHNTHFILTTTTGAVPQGYDRGGDS